MVTGLCLDGKLSLLIATILSIFFPATWAIADGNKFGLSSCVYECISRIRSLPESNCLITLDGREILLDDIFTECESKWPCCCLFEKFYHWESEIKFVVSKSLHGDVKHKIRVYNNCPSICHPDKNDIKKTHGDVVEFYNTDGNFMGIAVYMGDGKYAN